MNCHHKQLQSTAKYQVSPIGTTNNFKQHTARKGCKKSKCSLQIDSKCLIIIYDLFGEYFTQIHVCTPTAKYCKCLKVPQNTICQRSALIALVIYPSLIHFCSLALSCLLTYKNHWLYFIRNLDSNDAGWFTWRRSKEGNLFSIKWFFSQVRIRHVIYFSTTLLYFSYCMHLSLRNSKYTGPQSLVNTVLHLAQLFADLEVN